MGFNHLSSTALQNKTTTVPDASNDRSVFEISKIMLKMVTECPFMRRGVSLSGNYTHFGLSFFKELSRSSLSYFDHV